jgi:hypothetical protein
VIYILIAVIIGYHGSTSSTVAEFNNKEACQAAAVQFSKMYAERSSGYDHAVVFCAIKGEMR